MYKFKTAIISLLFLCYFSAKAMAVDCAPVNTNITLSTQTQVDDFQTDHGPCDNMTARLSITGSDITNLDGLSDIFFIKTLNINDATALIDIAGLSNLSTADNITIAYASSLPNLDGLSGLMTVNGFFNIEGCDLLQNINGLSNLNSVGNNFSIEESLILTSLDGLSNLNSVGNLIVNFNPELLSLNGLQGLTHLTLGLLSLQDNPKLTSLTALSNLQLGIIDVQIRDNIVLNNLNGLSQLRSVGGNLVIENNLALNDCTALIKLVDEIDHAEAGPGPGSAGIVDIGDQVFISNNLTNCNSIAEIIASVVNVRLYVDVDTLADSSCALGSCWEHAYNNLQDALFDANFGDEIWVASGVYYPDVGGTQVDNDQNSTFSLRDSVSLYGGFNGTETTLNQRNPELNVTILSGDITQNDVYINADNIALRTIDVVIPNSYHVVVGSAVDSNTVLDGFTINAGQAISLNGGSDLSGGGIYCGNNTSGPSINNMVFMANRANKIGGASYGCSQNVTNSQYTNNFSNDQSGAISANGGYFENVLFQGNTSLFAGGALRNQVSPIILINVKFIKNQSLNTDGGGLYLFADATLENVLFQGNKAGPGNGDEGGALFIQGASNSSLTNVTFTGNKAGDLGAAITSRSTGTLDIRNSIIWNNQDSTGQGALSASINSLAGGITTISNSLIQSSGSSLNWDVTAGIDGGNNLDQEPLFILDTDPTIAPTSVGDARLMDMSIAIDAGENSFVTVTTDLDNLQRIRNSIVDMGAYEFFEEQVFKDGFE